MTDSNLLLSGKTQYAAPTPSDSDVIPFSMTSGGRVRADVAGTVAISGTPAVTVSGTTTDTPTNGTPYSLTGAATTNAASIKASAGNLYEISVFNPTAATAYVRLYNKASAPTVGTDVPVLTIPVTASGYVAIPFGVLGKRFSTGIALAITAAAANNDATALATAGVLVSATYL